MKKDVGIISFDLVHGGNDKIDLRNAFPLSVLHVVRSTKPLLDTVRPSHTFRGIDLSVPAIVSVPRLSSFSVLDIAHTSLAKKRNLSSGPYRDIAVKTIDICPPLQIPYGSLDVRGEAIVSEKRYADIYRRSLPYTLHARRMLKTSARYVIRRRKPILTTIALFLILTVPTLLYTKSLLESAYADLASLRELPEKTIFIDRIQRARADFERANILFSPFRILPGESVDFARIMLDGGLTLSRGLDTLTATLPSNGSGTLALEKSEYEDSAYRPEAKNISFLAPLGITEPTRWMRENSDALRIFSASLKDAGSIYAEAKGIDHERSSEIAHVGRGLEKISEVFGFYVQNESDILALLGADTPERYIVFNQNRDEIRANGGFPGSIVSFTLFRGNIEDYRTDDVYYYDWNLYPFVETPPPGLALLSNNYGLRDVNYYPDFRDTLEKANTFIEKSGDPTVTVGIALHQGVIEDILDDIGPVTLSGVLRSFDSKNFSSLMSVLVESRFAEETSAKDILRHFVEAFVRKIHEEKAYEEVFTHIERALRDGEILFASRNDKIDTFLSRYKIPLPWENNTSLTSLTSGEVSLSGNILANKANWIYPLLTSLSGNKSDRIIERTYISETTEIGKCEYMNKVTLTHKHTYSSLYEREILSFLEIIGIRDKAAVEKMLLIQGKGRNKTYLRLIVPKGASLTGSTAGITEKYIREGKELSFTLETPMGSTTSKTFRYTLSIPTCDSTIPKLDWHRQPGLRATVFESR